ncbi:MAG: hypothetical protein NVSMB51_07740 [Solirubrobacteraceae bacterium]
MITTHTRIVAAIASLVLLGVIVELVRRRRLKEEYSVLWVLTALALLALSLSGALLKQITQAIGAVTESSTLYFFGLIFVLLLLLHFSVKISVLERRLTTMIQETALLAERRQREEEQASGRRPRGG